MILVGKETIIEKGKVAGEESTWQYWSGCWGIGAWYLA